MWSQAGLPGRLPGRRSTRWRQSGCQLRSIPPLARHALGYTRVGAWQASQVDDLAVAPLGSETAEFAAVSHHLPGVIDAQGFTRCGAQQASQVDDPAVAP